MASSRGEPHPFGKMVEALGSSQKSNAQSLLSSLGSLMSKKNTSSSKFSSLSDLKVFQVPSNRLKISPPRKEGTLLACRSPEMPRLTPLSRYPGREEPACPQLCCAARRTVFRRIHVTRQKLGSRENVKAFIALDYTIKTV